MSSKACSSNASQNLTDSDTTFCEELEKNNYSLRKRNPLSYSESLFNSQAQTKKLSFMSKMDEKKVCEIALEGCILKIRDHLRKIRIMPINEIQSLVNDVNKIDTPDKESKAMKNKVLSQLSSMFDETFEIEQRFSSLNISTRHSMNIFQNSITSNKTNCEQTEKSFSFDYNKSSKVNTSQFSNCINSSIVDTVQKDLNMLKENEIFKNQDLTKKYEEILHKSSTISYSFNENMLSNVNSKTPSAKAAQTESNEIMEWSQFEKGKENNFNSLATNMSSENIIPSSLVQNNAEAIIQEEYVPLANDVPSKEGFCSRLTQNTIEEMFISQESNAGNNLSNTISDSNEPHNRNEQSNLEQSFPIQLLTNNLFKTPSVNLCESQEDCNKPYEGSKFLFNECPNTYQDYSKVTVLSISSLTENNVNLTLIHEDNTENSKNKNVTSPILKRKTNYKTQKCTHTKYSSKFKSKYIANKVKRLKPHNFQLNNNINILQQFSVLPPQINVLSQTQQSVYPKEFSRQKENESTQSLNHNKIIYNSLNNDFINENGSSSNDDKLEFASNDENLALNSGDESGFQTLIKDVVEDIDKFKQEFANWILQTATEDYSKKNKDNKVTEKASEKNDIRDLDLQLTAKEKIEKYSKINELANFYRDELRSKGLPKIEEFFNKPFCVDFDEIDRKYQQK